MFKYKVIYDEIMGKIERGELRPGDKLPTEVALCAEGYSRNTVRQALALLEQDGVIIRRRGSGNVVKPMLGGRPQTGNVALIFTTFSMYIFSDALNGINDGLRGWATPMLYSSDAKLEEEERILLELIEKKPDGVIVQAFNTALPNPNLPLYQTLIDSGVPVVFLFSYYEGLKGYLYVANDDRQGVAQAVRYLHGLGRRRFGGVFVPEMLQFHHRFEGYTAECKRLDIPIRSEKVLWLATEASKNPELLRRELVALSKDCDAILCASDWHAMLAVETLTEEGIKIPDDIAIISFDNSYLCDYAPVPITSMDCDPYGMGNIAAQKIKNVLAGQKEVSVNLPWHMVLRKSS